MNKSITTSQVKNLPLGFTPTGYVNRKERRSKEYKDKLKVFQDAMNEKLADQKLKEELENDQELNQILKELQ